MDTVALAATAPKVPAAERKFEFLNFGAAKRFGVGGGGREGRSSERQSLTPDLSSRCSSTSLSKRLVDNANATERESLGSSSSLEITVN